VALRLTLRLAAVPKNAQENETLCTRGAMGAVCRLFGFIHRYAPVSRRLNAYVASTEPVAARKRSKG
jgi:hypothetical protein